MYSILRGMRVVECASFIAAPSCALYLRQLGADVIRIDPIGGGMDFRRWPVTQDGSSLYWEGLQKGKRSVAIDLSQEDGRQLARRLITAPGPDAGLFVTNYPAGGTFSHTDLCKFRSDLITIRVLGWRDGSPGVDYTVNAAIGVPYMTGPEESVDPINHVLPAWDLLTGSYAAFALMAAERHRFRAGIGQEVMVPLSDVALTALANMGQVGEVLTAGDRPRAGNALFGAFGRDFRTADDELVMVVAITSRQWNGLVTALGLRDAVETIELSLGVSFAEDEGNRFAYRDALFPCFAEVISTFSIEELRKRFDLHGVLWSRYQTLLTALTEDSRFRPEAPLFSVLDHPSGLSYPAPGAAATFKHVERNSVVRAPHLGEHTDQVLSEVLSLSDTEIGRLHDARIVAAA